MLTERVRDIGEFGLITRFSQLLRPAGIPVELGDDAAAFPARPGHWLLATVDTLVEDVHFRRDWAKAWEIGYKSMAVNVSDIAAMGGVPTYALISLAAPGSLAVDWVEQFYLGLEACGTQWGVGIVGGDTVSADKICISVTLLGETEAGRTLVRSGGKPGDLLMVTGELGGSGAGLEELLSPKTQNPCRTSVIRHHLLPVPRLAEGRLLNSAEGAGTGAVTDLSDGLAHGVLEIARASGVGVEVYGDLLPIAEDTRETALCRGQDPLHYALYGGEDYELLFSLAPSRSPAVRTAIRDSCGTPVTVIGCLLPPDQGLVLCREGQRLALEKGGYDHFLSLFTHA